MVERRMLLRRNESAGREGAGRTLTPVEAIVTNI